MNKPIRVLQFVTLMNRNGLENRLMDIYRNIDRTKIQFDFVSNRDYDGQFDDEIRSLGGKVYHMYQITPKNFFKYLKQLDKFFEDHPEYKIVHAHLNTLSTWPLRAAKKAGVPVRIAHSRNASMDFNIKALYKSYSRLFINDVVTDKFACSRSAGAWLFGEKKLDDGNFHVIPNSIQLDKFHFKDEIRDRMRKELGIQENEMAVVDVARFAKQKNHTYLLKVFCELHKMKPESKLYLVGIGDLEQDIKNEAEKSGIADSVVFVGSRSDIYNVLQAMDVFLFPSFYEGFGTVIIEAQCSYLPLIASDTIPHETKLCDCVEFMTIKADPKEWAMRAIELYEKTQRFDNCALVKEKGYDIRDTYTWMQNFYLDKLNSIT
ncbi:MAG: glycosyltransferase family 1 protein [Clostridia bacterium]|nr:glycosyltransferase family 1 protein [Clostridia bacterium]